MINGRSQIGAFQARRRAWSAEPDVYKTGATPFWEFARWGDSLA
jgi:hypothetical protein